MTIWSFISVLLFARLFYHIIRNKRQILRYQQVFSIQAEEILQDIVKRTKTGQNYQLIVSKDISIPMILGFFTPVIGLPEIELTDSELRNILQHEWNHYLLKHLWIKLAVYVIWVLFWWNPLVYFLKNGINHILEINSDLKLTVDMNDNQRVEYIESTLKIMKHIHNTRPHMPVSAISLISSKNVKETEQRFRTVLDYKKPTNKLKKYLVTALFIVAFVVSEADYAPV